MCAVALPLPPLPPPIASTNALPAAQRANLGTKQAVEVFVAIAQVRDPSALLIVPTRSRRCSRVSQELSANFAHLSPAGLGTALAWLSKGADDHLKPFFKLVRLRTAAND
jgi:hypothetical protein